MKSQQLPPLLYGLVSGTLSATLLDFTGKDSIYWFPGVVFGVFFAIYMARIPGAPGGRATIFRFILFVVLSTLAYRAAVQVYVITDDIRPGSGELALSIPDWAQGFCSGFAGSLILVISVWICTRRKPALRLAGFTVLLGSILGPLIAAPEFEVLGYELGALILFLPWQAAVFLPLSSMLKER